MAEILIVKTQRWSLYVSDRVLTIGVRLLHRATELVLEELGQRQLEASKAKRKRKRS